MLFRSSAFSRGEGMDLVDDDSAEPLEQKRAVLVAEQQAQRLRRRQQHLRRLHPLPRLAIRRRVAGAGLDPDVEAHLRDRDRKSTRLNSSHYCEARMQYSD